MQIWCTLKRIQLLPYAEWKQQSIMHALHQAYGNVIPPPRKVQICRCTTYLKVSFKIIFVSLRRVHVCALANKKRRIRKKRAGGCRGLFASRCGSDRARKIGRVIIIFTPIYCLLPQRIDAEEALRILTHQRQRRDWKLPATQCCLCFGGVFPPSGAECSWYRY